jgi:hypothetical protein
MKKTIKYRTALLGLIFVAGFGFAQAQQNRSPKEIFTWWFDNNCGIGQEDLVKMVTANGEELSTLFIQAFESGADKGWVDQRVESEMKMMRANLAYIEKNNGNATGLSKEQIDAYKKTDLKAYEAELRASLSSGYQLTALHGLVQTKSESARAYLTKLSKNKRDPNSALATEMLLLMGK